MGGSFFSDDDEFGLLAIRAPARVDGTWARRGWIAATALLALALVLHALTTFGESRRAVDGLDRGQADFLGASLHETLASHHDLPDSVIVARFLDANEARGLRYVALGGDGAHAGVGAGGATVEVPQLPRESRSGRMPLMPVNDRLRAFFPGPYRTSSARQQQEPYMVIEFQPIAAARVMRSARRNLALAIIVAVVLFLAAWLFLRTSVRYDTTRLRLAQQRHLALLGEMSAVLAHEIRNPLAALKGHAQLAAERLAEGSREKTCIDYVIESANRLDVLTSDLLNFARTGPAELAPTDPGELMQTAVRDVFGDAPMAVDCELAPELWQLDAGRVRQALINLLDNARQSSPPDVFPNASVEQRSNQLVMEVRDFGPGLPTGNEARVFDAFFTTRTNGTGLGLAVASRVAEMHGGTISARNHPEGGAVFQIVIPNRN